MNFESKYHFLGENQAKPGMKVFFSQTMVHIHEKLEAAVGSKHRVKLLFLGRKLGKSRHGSTTNQEREGKHVFLYPLTFFPCISPNFWWFCKFTTLGALAPSYQERTTKEWEFTPLKLLNSITLHYRGHLPSSGS